MNPPRGDHFKLKSSLHRNLILQGEICAILHHKLELLPTIAPHPLRKFCLQLHFSRVSHGFVAEDTNDSRHRLKNCDSLCSPCKAEPEGSSLLRLFGADLLFHFLSSFIQSQPYALTILGRARRSQDGLMESCLHRRCGEPLADP